MKSCYISAILVISVSSLFAQKITINGIVKDKDTGEVLIGAAVFCPEIQQGTTTNQYGFYSISFPKAKSSLIFSYVGYETIQHSINTIGDTTMEIALQSGQVLREVEIVESREERQLENTRMGAISLPINQIRAVPALMGEVDVLKVLQLLPGVQSGTEGSSGLYVRGGGSDQNLILLDGVPVYNASHLFGFFSVFNADAINHVELIKGGFPARYGGRLSSVIDISMKEGNTKKLKAEGSVGLISSKITIDGPVKNENTSFIISARRTYIDALALLAQKLIDNDEVLGYYFYDLNAKINHKFNPRNRLFVSLYTGTDKVSSRNESTDTDQLDSRSSKNDYKLQWGNLTSALRWNSVLSEKIFSNVTATYSRYQFITQETFSTTLTNPDTTLSEHYSAYYHSGIRDFALKTDFDFMPSPKHFIKFGGQAIAHHFSPGALAVKSSVALDTVAGSSEKNANEYSLYLEDELRLGRILKINLGVHNSAFSVDNQFYSSVQPRFALSLMVTPNLRWKLSHVWMTQFIHLLTNSGVGLPTDLWVPATARIRPQQSKLSSTGFAWNINQYYELSLEGYYKEMDGLIEYQDGSNYLDVQNDWQEKVETGKGKSYGTEFFIHRKIGKLSGWVGYTLSWTNRKFNQINNGEWFPYKYDRRHDLEIVAAYKPKPMKDLSLSWVYGTGNAITMPLATFSPPEEFKSWNISEPAMYYGDRNSFRMRAYHRLDLSYSVRKKRKWGERAWTFSIYNLYNRKNPFFLQLDNTNGSRKIYQYSLFPVIPSIAYGFKF